MKTCCFTLIVLLFSVLLQAQHVGVNTSEPQASLDVNGALALRAAANIQELNQPVSLLDLSNRSYVRFFVNNGNGNLQRNIKLSAGVPGQISTVEFTGAGNGTLINGSRHAGGGKVILAGDVLFQNKTMVLSLVFVNNNWRELYRTENLPNETDTISVTYNIPGTYLFTVPPGVQQIRVTVNGAGGWGGGSFPPTTGSGGRGGKLICLINTTEGQQLEVGIGAGGGVNQKGKITYIKSGTTYLLLAGAGGNGSKNGGVGGAGGSVGGNGLIGQNSMGTGGGGATVNAGGAGGISGGAGAGQAGIALTGGTLFTFNQGEGFGGDGWFGGGSSGAYTSGSGSNPWASGGGGGGSNYQHSTVTSLLNNSLGNEGGLGAASGGHGNVKIEWY
ncbi:MAG: hypothetical protein V4722_28825 [Bacteroidota bacterium]